MKLFAEELISFPDPQGPIEEGIVDMSDDLRVERLLEAYSFGIFPWPHEDLPTLWFSPSERGVIEFSEFHVPRSLAKLIKKPDYSFTFDRCFERVIEECANLRRAEQPGTWITPNLQCQEGHPLYVRKALRTVQASTGKPRLRWAAAKGLGKSRTS